MRIALIAGSNGPPNSALNFAESDAERVSAVLSSISCNFVVRPLIGKTANETRQNILSELENLSPSDEALVYFICHGFADDGELFLLFSDSDVNKAMSTCIRADDIVICMKRCRSRQRALILDCCDSAVLLDQSGIRAAPLAPAQYSKLKLKSKVFGILLAGDRLGPAFEFPNIEGGGGGFFSTNFVNGLSTHKRQADYDNNGEISLLDMRRWLVHCANKHNQSNSSRKVLRPTDTGTAGAEFSLSRQLDDWPVIEVQLPDDIPARILPIRPLEGMYAVAMARYPVTISAYKEVSKGWEEGSALFARRRKAHRSHLSFNVMESSEFNQATQPAVGFTLRRVRAYCGRLEGRARANGMVHFRGFSPPSKTMWQVAACGNSVDRSVRDYLRTQREWHHKASSPAPCGGESLRLNKFGFADLLGNVWEWCINYEAILHFGSASLWKQIEDALWARETPSLEVQFIGGGFRDDLELISIEREHSLLDTPLGNRYVPPEVGQDDVGLRVCALVNLDFLKMDEQAALWECEPLPDQQEYEKKSFVGARIQCNDTPGTKTGLEGAVITAH